MRNYKTEGIVIKRRNIGEADRILTVFTRRFGKIQIKAKGVRRITSRRSSHIELLNLSLLSLYKGRGALPILTEVQTIEDYSAIKEDLARVGFSYHLCELIDGLCAENQENSAVFDLLEQTFWNLSGSLDILETIHEFEVQLLTLLGYWTKLRPSQNLDTEYFIEDILERKLRSKKLFSRFS